MARPPQNGKQLHTTEQEATAGHNQPKDKFQEDADIVLNSWAEQRRAHHKLELECSDLKIEIEGHRARIESLMRENSRLQEQVTQSQEREGQALRRIGLLESSIHTAARSLHDVVSTAVTLNREDGKDNSR